MLVQNIYRLTRKHFNSCIDTPSQAHLCRTIFGAAISPYPPGFSFWPNFLNTAEQKLLLGASLSKLDGCEARSHRRRRRDYWSSRPQTPTSLSEMFAPDELYTFEQGHYDGVIHHYREMHLTSWPSDEFEGLQGVLERVHSLCPTKDTQTHLLHLASHGDILPHVDNISASGSWILGVSLGAERRLRMREANSPANYSEFSINIPSGSVYLQRDDVRFSYMHAIERDQEEGQRLSVMIRDLNNKKLSL
ncbi:hypothetical protein CPB83DRAFT_847634 [Crepidotus variabilis]|uniref:Alpha-ketoglutarate-dependent dioxygenase AlkB-like domain-containing protein n=1 Tax=Crepidotus variabilis TaxID=179855 RepID=A0A9P6EM95_9AGAR|nr:hypothetical protein CPB83DRAFT_847634 [Crepidotus variabilis]